MNKKIVVGMSGASGAGLAITCLKILKQMNVETHLVITKPAEMTVVAETDYSISDVKKLADNVYNNADVGALCASGTFKNDGMIVIPCSMKTLGEVANGMCGNLLTRTADVILKERRKLVMVTREAPLNLSHIRNMETITLMGGVIVPPVPAFYTKPETVDDIIYQITARSIEALDLG
ncbi:MAG: UbiX family flavin prenyltransferase, partial [Alphaproteobacteria bacterium]